MLRLLYYARGQNLSLRDKLLFYNLHGCIRDRRTINHRVGTTRARVRIREIMTKTI